VSAYPILALKYNSDLYEYTDKLNTQCYKEKNEKERNKYVWQISNYLYDFNQIQEYIKSADTKSAINESNATDEYYLNVMKIYKEYYQFSSTQFAVFILLVILYGLRVFLSSNQYSYQEWFHFSLFILMIVFVILFIIIYALILKKITEIYRDTGTLDYVKFMKKIDILINEATKDNTTKTVFEKKENLKELLKNLYDTSYDAKEDIKTYNIGNIVFTEDVLYQLEGTYTSLSINIDRKDIDDYFFRYHQKKHKEDIQNKINVVASYLYAYLVFVLPFMMLLFRSITNYYIYPIIMGLLLIAVSSYFIYAYLH
jgi:hypothetical protein